MATRCARSRRYVAIAHKSLLPPLDMHRRLPFLTCDCQKDGVRCQFQRVGMYPADDSAILDIQRATGQCIMVARCTLGRIGYAILSCSVYNAVGDAYVGG